MVLRIGDGRDQEIEALVVIFEGLSRLLPASVPIDMA